MRPFLARCAPGTFGSLPGEGIEPENSQDAYNLENSFQQYLCPLVAHTMPSASGSPAF